MFVTSTIFLLVTTANACFVIRHHLEERRVREADFKLWDCCAMKLHISYVDVANGRLVIPVTVVAPLEMQVKKGFNVNVTIDPTNASIEMPGDLFPEVSSVYRRDAAKEAARRLLADGALKFRLVVPGSTTLPAEPVKLEATSNGCFTANWSLVADDERVLEGMLLRL